MKITVSGALTLIFGFAIAQERCDAPSPGIFCNTTEILQYETSDCRPFHIFLARGSDEPYPGRLGNITREICSAIGGTDCGFENIEFPAKSTAWGVDEWCKSAAKGAAGGQAQLKTFNQKCPNSKIILLGFSQGGSVTQDILGGGGGHVFSCDQAVNPALDASSAPGSNIVAAVTFGAVIRSRNQNFTIGEGKNYDGRRARTPEQLAALNKYSSVLRDYCHYGDPMCAVGSLPEDVNEHLNYFLEHNEEVTQWVAQMAKASENVSSSKPSSKPQPTLVASTSVVAKPATISSVASVRIPVAISSVVSVVIPSATLSVAPLTTPLATPSSVRPTSTSAADSSVAQPSQTSNSNTGTSSAVTTSSRPSSSGSTGSTSTRTSSSKTTSTPSVSTASASTGSANTFRVNREYFSTIIIVSTSFLLFAIW